MKTFPPARSSKLTSGYAAALASAAILSTTAIFIRYLTQNYDLPALVLAFWRDTLTALTLLPLLAWLRPQLLKINRADLGYLAGYGLLLALFNSIWTTSVHLNGAALSTVLVSCSSAFTALLGWWLLKENLGWAKIAAVVLSLGGCVLVSGAYEPGVWTSQWAGIFTGIFSGLLYAIYSLMGRSASQRGLSPWTTLLYTFGFAAFFLLVLNLISGGGVAGTAASPAALLWSDGTAVGWGILFLLAAGPTLAGFGLYNVSLSLLPSSVANLIVTLEPPFTALLAFLFLGERLTLVQLAGSGLILGGVVLLRVFERKPPEVEMDEVAGEPVGYSRSV